MKYKNIMIILCTTSILLFSCTPSDHSNVDIQSSESDEITTIKTDEAAQIQTIVTSPNTEAVTTEIEEAPIEVGDGLYHVSSIPKPEQVTLPCKYGYVLRSEGGTIEAFGKTIDFSKIPNEHEDETTPHSIYDQIEYCVCDEGKTVYFADSDNFYRADTDLRSPEVLFKLDTNQTDYPYAIGELIALENTDLLCFSGWARSPVGDCFGSIDVKNKTADFVSCNNSTKSVLCNAGVMLYDYAAAREGRNSTVLYWECGKVYEIPLQNPKESELGVNISLNGMYICTYMRGKAEDGRLVERYSVYDTKSGRLVKSFDWTAAKMKADDHTNKALPFVYINEETESAYFYNNEVKKYYQFYFGDCL